MTTHMPGCVRAETAGADLSAAQYLGVKFSSGSIVLAGAQEAIGVLTNAPASGARADVAVTGVVKAVAAAAISAGAWVTSDANGKMVATTTAGQKILGIAMDAAAADGDVIAVALSQGSI